MRLNFLKRMFFHIDHIFWHSIGCTAARQSLQKNTSCVPLTKKQMKFDPHFRAEH